MAWNKAGQVGADFHGTLADAEDAQPWGYAESLLAGCHDHIDAPLVHADFLAGYGADSVQYDLFYVSSSVIVCSGKSGALTKVSGEHFFADAARAFASERTP